MWVFRAFSGLAELDWAVKLSLTVGGSAGRLGAASRWGVGELEMCAYPAYTPFDEFMWAAVWAC